MAVPAERKMTIPAGRHKAIPTDRQADQQIHKRQTSIDILLYRQTSSPITFTVKVLQSFQVTFSAKLTGYHGPRGRGQTLYA